MNMLCSLVYFIQVLLVVGGWSIPYNGKEDDQLSSTELFFPSKNRWERARDLPKRLAGLRAAHLNGQVVVTGGENGGSLDAKIPENPGNEVFFLQFFTW